MIRHVTRSLTFAAAGVALMVSAACGGSSGGGAKATATSAATATATVAATAAATKAGTMATTTTTGNAVGTITGEQGWPRVEGLRGKRYCEILLLQLVDGRLNADVWNTFGLNECPQAAWDGIDMAAVKTERGVLAALRNGPRYWLMDAIEKRPGGERQLTTFGTVEMFHAATVDLGAPPPNLAPYTERRVARETVFEYAKGAEVYELVTLDGTVYVMQAWSQQANPNQTEASLKSLASTLKPPDGWQYRVRTLDSVWRVTTPTGDAAVVQDEFMNTYQRIDN